MVNRSVAAVVLTLIAFAWLPSAARAHAQKSRVSASPGVDNTPTLLLLVGSMKTDPQHQRLADGLSTQSRHALGQLPGVRLLGKGDPSPRGPQAAGNRTAPLVMITGKLCDVGQTQDGDNVVVTAKVEYFVHRMPGQSIAAVVSGTAKAKVGKVQVRTRRLREKLEYDLMSAAVQSAALRTAPALKAALD